MAEYEVRLRDKDLNKTTSDSTEFYEKLLIKLNKEKKTFLKQKNALHDLLEQGVYTKDDFLLYLHKE